MRHTDRPAEGAGYALTGDDGDSWGYAQEAAGLFAPRADGGRRVALLGCGPLGRLRTCADHVGGEQAVAGNARLTLLDTAGAEMGSYCVQRVTVEAVGPSSRGGGLVDLTVGLRGDDLLPAAGRTWELVRAGRLDRTGMWRDLPPADRHAWLSVALKRQVHRALPDDPPGAGYELDGRQVVDADSLYCALGEAVNGPGGYFGWNLDAVHDCLYGGWGATPPFTLYWDHAEVSRARLAQADTLGGNPVFGTLVEILREHGVQVVTDRRPAP